LIHLGYEHDFSSCRHRMLSDTVAFIMTLIFCLLPLSQNDKHLVSHGVLKALATRVRICFHGDLST
jgi:hypothetical protein